jgi:heavy metal sensor kinase
MNTRSLPFRLGLWYTLLLSGAFVLIGAATYFGLRQYLRFEANGVLERRTERVVRMVEDVAANTPAKEIARDIEARIAPELTSAFIWVGRDDGPVVFLSGPPADDSFDSRKVPIVRLEHDRAVRAVPEQHLLVKTVAVNTPSGHYLIETGVSTLPMEALLRRLLGTLAILLPVFAAAAAAGGYMLVIRALKPVERMATLAAEMSLLNPESRLPLIATGDALERLSGSLNTMLGRLRESVLTSRRFLADASHELRTPLTVIKGELQEASSEELELDEVRERIGSVLEEVDRLERLVSGLLVLSRFDAGESCELELLDLSELARSTAEHMRLIAEDRSVALKLTGTHATLIQGDRARLTQVIVNLLDNAIRYTPRGGTVTLRTWKDVDQGVLDVIDTGIGIPANAIPRIFDRFFRVDEARSRHDGGAGIGLSIVKSICSMHGAEIGVESRVGSGSRFRIRFPAVNALRLEARPGAPVMRFSSDSNVRTAG